MFGKVRKHCSLPKWITGSKRTKIWAVVPAFNVPVSGGTTWMLTFDSVCPLGGSVTTLLGGQVWPGPHTTWKKESPCWMTSPTRNPLTQATYAKRSVQVV